MTVIRDYLEPQRQQHQLALDLFALAQAGDAELTSAPQGQLLDVSPGGQIDRQLRQLLAAGELRNADQISRVSEGTVLPLTLGRVVEGFDEAWHEIVRTWRTDKGKRPDEIAVDRYYVETHLLEERDVFITDDRALRSVCERLRDEFGYAIEARPLADYLSSRRP